MDIAGDKPRQHLFRIGFVVAACDPNFDAEPTGQKWKGNGLSDSQKKSVTVQATLCLCIFGSTPTIAQRLLTNDPETDSTHYSNGKDLFKNPKLYRFGKIILYPNY
jgi:hypothetical protein